MRTRSSSRTRRPTEQEIEDIFGGNLCRCTGYRPILHGVRTLACDHDAAGDQTQQCVTDPAFPVQCRDASWPDPPRRAPAAGRIGGRSTSAAAAGNGIARSRSRRSSGSRRSSSSEAGRERVKLVFGNTASGVYQDEKPRYFIDISAIAELGEIAEDEAGIHVGAAVTIQRLIDVATDAIGRTAGRGDDRACGP